MTATLRTTVTAPGVYDMPDATYHADPVAGGSLSSSGARKLLPPNCPARFRYELDHPRPANPVFDFGHAAHKQVLGVGAEVVVVDAANWQTKAAREARDKAYAAGKVPVLAGEHDRVLGMAAALRAHPTAAALLNPAAGQPEQSLFWTDDEAGIWCRSRLDWLPNPTDRRMVIADYKTCESAELGHIERAVHNYGYHQQAAFYIDGVKALGLADDPAFVFVFQEKTAPYLITIVQLDPEAERIGRAENRKAIDIYRRCKATDQWPAYSDDIELISLPPWVERRHQTEESW
jgi:hypothetical protein